MVVRTAIIVPAYNEAAYIGPVLESLRKHPDIGQFRVLVIDDGSTDATLEIVRAVPGVELLQHHRNRGLGKTFSDAVMWSLQEGIECMVFFDADGQFDVNDIPKLTRPVVEKRVDFVLGSRFSDGSPQGIPRAKLLGNKALAWFMSRVTGVQLRDVSCGFRAYGREAMLRVSLSGGFTYTQEVILDLLYKGLHCMEVPVVVKYFPERKSAISSNLWRYGWRVFKIVTRAIRDYQPMKFFGFAGGVLFIIGLLLDIWMLWYFSRTGSFTPYKAVGFAGAFFNFIGMTIIFIGLVADMLNRIRRNEEESLYLLKKSHYDAQRKQS